MKKALKWLLILILFGILITCTVTYKSSKGIKIELHKKDSIR